MKKSVMVIVLLMIINVQAQANSLDLSAEARDFNSSPEFIFKHKDFSFDWIRADDSEHFFKLKLDKKIFSLMGTGLEWSVALNALDAGNNFYVLPSGGINLYMRIRPRLDIYAQFSGLPLGNRGHFSDFESGLRYSPQKNLSISAGWRRIDFRLRRGGGFGTFERSGLFTGIRYDF